MEIKKLTPEFYEDHQHLEQALDNYDNHWNEYKQRGYGVVLFQQGKLIFGIPIRTSINHSASFITEHSARNNIRGKGLDFSKALLIPNRDYISQDTFKIPSKEFRKIQNKERTIILKFSKYIRKYAGAIIKRDENVLSSPEYRHTTLVNYHKELGIKQR